MEYSPLPLEHRQQPKSVRPLPRHSDLRIWLPVPFCVAFLLPVTHGAGAGLEDVVEPSGRGEPPNVLSYKPVKMEIEL
jgi:hypothetical protein